MAAGYEVPKGMFIHGFLLMEGQKMSKSLGNVLDPFEVIERFGADALRYYCFREVSFGHDGSVSAAGFESRYDTELANEYGNLASRTLAMIDRYRDGVRPGSRADPALASGATVSTGSRTRCCELLDRAELTQALEEIWTRVRRLNRYVEETRAVGSRQGRGRRRDAPATQVLYSLAEGLRVSTLLLHAVHARDAASGCSTRSASRTARSRRSARTAAARGRELAAALPEDRAAAA